jgi:hypothetical protein
MTAAAPCSSTLIVHVPMRFAVHGGRKSIVSDLVRAPSQPRVENTLLKALARAHRWRRMIENGEYASISELAKAEGVNDSYVCRILRLTLLAPVIVNDILDVRHNSYLMLKRLMKPLPIKWNEQLESLTVSDSAGST